MNTTFRKSFIWSATIHIVLIASIALIIKYSYKPKPVDSIQWIDLAPELGTSDRSQPSTPGGGLPQKASLPVQTPSAPEPSSPPPAPKPKPSPIPEHTKTESDLLAPPKPSLPLKEKPDESHPNIKKSVQPKTAAKPETETTSGKAKIKISHKKIVRTIELPITKPSASSSTVGNTPSFNASAFAQKLLSKLPDNGGLVAAKGAEGSGSSAKGQASNFGWYFNHIFQEMYHVWHPPFGLPIGICTQVLIRVEKNGIISKVSLASSSGNQLMDESALAAANNVKKLQPLPEGLGPTYAEITINFKIQKS